MVRVWARDARPHAFGGSSATRTTGVSLDAPHVLRPHHQECLGIFFFLMIFSNLSAKFVSGVFLFGLVLEKCWFIQRISYQ